MRGPLAVRRDQPGHAETQVETEGRDLLRRVAVEVECRPEADEPGEGQFPLGITGRPNGDLGPKHGRIRFENVIDDDLDAERLGQRSAPIGDGRGDERVLDDPEVVVGAGDANDRRAPIAPVRQDLGPVPPEPPKNRLVETREFDLGQHQTDLVQLVFARPCAPVHGNGIRDDSAVVVVRRTLARLGDHVGSMLVLENEIACGSDRGIPRNHILGPHDPGHRSARGRAVPDGRGVVRGRCGRLVGTTTAQRGKNEGEQEARRMHCAIIPPPTAQPRRKPQPRASRRRTATDPRRPACPTQGTTGP